MAALAFLLAFPLASGQAPKDLPRVTGSAEVSLVNIDVVVTGKDGNPVHGLTAADFEVRHAGKLVTITNFREERADAPVSPGKPRAESPAGGSTPVPASSSAAEGPVRTPRHLVLFIDYLALPDPREREEVFGSLKTLLRQSVAAGDEAMIVVWQRAVRKVYPFTGKFEALEYALDATAGNVARLGPEKTEIEKLATDDVVYAWAGTGDSQLSRNLDAMQVFADIKGKTAALKGLIAMMAGMEGRKAVIVVSRRFSRRAGAEFSAPIDTKPLIDSVIDAANAADVTLHTWNATEWEPDVPSAGTSRFTNPRTNSRGAMSMPQMNWKNDMDTLGPMAEKTGGVAIGTTMQAAQFAAKVTADLQSWYSIGYPAPQGGNKAADVRVRVNQRGVTVRARRSIVEKTPEEEMKDRTLANLFRSDQNARLPIQVTVSRPTPAKKGHLLMPVQIRIPVKSLVGVPSANGTKGAVSVFAAAAGPAGEFSDVTRQSYEFEVPAPGLSESNDFLTYDVDVEIVNASSRVSIAVWDEIGKEAGFRLIVPATH